MRLGEAERWKFEKDMGTRSPLLYAVNRDTNLSYAAFIGCQGGAARADVIISKAQSPNKTVHDIQCDRDVYVDA